MVIFVNFLLQFWTGKIHMNKIEEKKIHKKLDIHQIIMSKITSYHFKKMLLLISKLKFDNLESLKH